MTILVIPPLSEADFWRYSLWEVFRQVLAGFYRNNVSAIVPFVKGAGKTFEPGYGFECDHIQYVDFPYNRSSVLEDVQMFASSKYSWSGVLSFASMTTADLMLPLTRHRPFTKRPKIATFLIQSLKEFYQQPFLLKKALFGLEVSDLVIFDSVATQRLALGCLNKLYNASRVMKISSKAPTIPLGIEVSSIDAVERKDYEKFTIVNGTLNFTWKKMPELLEVCASIYGTGRDFNLRMHWTNPDRSEADAFADKYPFVEVVHDQPREVYWESCRSSQVFLCTSRFESYGLSYLESLLGGCVGIYWAADWQRGVLPDNYPFVSRSLDGLRKQLLWVYDNYAQAKEKVAHVPQWVRDNHDARKHMDRFALTLDKWAKGLT